MLCNLNALFISNLIKTKLLQMYHGEATTALRDMSQSRRSAHKKARYAGLITLSISYRKDLQTVALL